VAGKSDTPGWTPSVSESFREAVNRVNVARENNIPIHTFEICGSYSRAVSEDCYLQQLASEALSQVEKMRLVDSPPMLAFVNQVPLPSLRQVELADCWLSIPDLEKLISIRSGYLEYLHFENTWVLEEEINAKGIYISKGSARCVLDHLASFPGADRLRLTMNRQPGGGYEAQKMKNVWKY
jgi:hypothetical protein